MGKRGLLAGRRHDTKPAFYAYAYPRRRLRVTPIRKAWYSSEQRVLTDVRAVRTSHSR